MPLNELAEAVGASADAFVEPARLDETLRSILDSALESIKGFDRAGLLISVKGRLSERAWTDEVAQQLDGLQAQAKQGPAVEVLKGPQAVVVPDLRHEQRWPRYTPRAVQLGAVAQISARMQLDRTGTLGSLNLYAATEPALDDEARSLAEVFAAQAAVAIGGAAVVTNLTEAMETRKVIGQATGILMERYRIDEAHAFAYLRRESSHRNVKLREIAKEIVQSLPGGGRAAT
ncbi:GAF and ANTAR domain-containing protein [Nocardioides sp.]|uniref:GAF and ANTAR domain-containing protein n=1 Tax=Nocardioides sp. TaxID=35761 RepID=UPI002ED1B1BB